MEALFTERACDGFLLRAPYYPGGSEDICSLVIPELQRRDLFHRDYAGETKRDAMGLKRSERIA